MQRKKLRFLIPWVLLGLLIVTSSMTAEGGINSWTSNRTGGGRIVALALDPVTPATLGGTYRAGVFKTAFGRSFLHSLIWP